MPWLCRGGWPCEPGRASVPAPTPPFQHAAPRTPHPAPRAEQALSWPSSNRRDNRRGPRGPGLSKAEHRRPHAAGGHGPRPTAQPTLRTQSPNSTPFPSRLLQSQGKGVRGQEPHLGRSSNVSNPSPQPERKGEQEGGRVLTHLCCRLFGSDSSGVRLSATCSNLWVGLLPPIAQGLHPATVNRACARGYKPGSGGRQALVRRARAAPVQLPRARRAVHATPRHALATPRPATPRALEAGASTSRVGSGCRLCSFSEDSFSCAPALLHAVVPPVAPQPGFEFYLYRACERHLPLWASCRVLYFKEMSRRGGQQKSFLFHVFTLLA